MTTTTLPSFSGLPRRATAGSWLTGVVALVVWVAFFASLSVPPEASLQGDLAARPAAGAGAVAEVPCPPSCRPARG